MLEGKAKTVFIAGIGVVLFFSALCGMMAISYKRMEKVHQTKADAAVLSLIDAAHYETVEIEREGAYRMIRSAYIALDKTRTPIGFLTLLSVPGYNGLVEVDVCMDTDGETILKIAVGANNETEGLGKKAGDIQFTSQFTDKKTPLDFNQIQAISSATITSSAVLDAVNLAGEFTKERLSGS